MAGNIRNARTTHPRKQARRQRAIFRFSIKESGSIEYLARKMGEAESLGITEPRYIA